MKLSESDLLRRPGCPICACPTASVHHAFVPISVVRCDDCSFLYADKTLSEDALNSYYTNFAGDRQRAGQFVNATVNAAAVSKLMKGRQFESILDIGTGYGYLLDRIGRKCKRTCAGVEISLAEAAYARDTLKLDVRQKLLAESGFEPGSFDLVASFETIEHINDPVGFVRELAKYAKPGGYVLINTDNFESWAVRKLGPNFPKWIPHAHISDFAPDTLVDCVRRAGGLDVVQTLSYTNWELLAKAFLSGTASQNSSAAEAFDLEATLNNEMQGGYRMFWLRKTINRTWFSLTHRRDLKAGLMYVLARKVE